MTDEELTEAAGVAYAEESSYSCGYDPQMSKIVEASSRLETEALRARKREKELVAALNEALVWLVAARDTAIKGCADDMLDLAANETCTEAIERLRKVARGAT